MNHETRLQIVVADYLRAVLAGGAFFFAIPNEHKPTAAMTARLNKMGRFPGVADLCLVWPDGNIGRMAFIELKVRRDARYGIKSTTYQAPSQKQFQELCERALIPYAVCRHTDEVAEALRRWGVPTREAA